MAKKRNHPPHKADTRGKPWLGIPHVVIKSEAYRQLPSMSKLILFSIVMRFNGHNNGRIAVSFRQIAHDLNRKNQSPFATAIAKLMEHGLIYISTEGDWSQRKAREYGLTFASSGNFNSIKAATNDYINWQPRAPDNEK